MAVISAGQKLYFYIHSQTTISFEKCLPLLSVLYHVSLLSDKYCFTQSPKRTMIWHGLKKWSTCLGGSKSYVWSLVPHIPLNTCGCMLIQMVLSSAILPIKKLPPSLHKLTHSKLEMEIGFVLQLLLSLPLRKLIVKKMMSMNEKR